MKLISCYIENFGKLKQKEYAFDSGITSFCEANGAGKTTLASFIKAMFYGLEPYRQNTKEFCDRQHFYPFDGGRFGGNLTFSMNGKTYKIERFFGEKSDTMDEVTVYEDGEKTDIFGENIGRSVFGIDKASFERTAFIGSEDIEIASTSSINDKLNRFLQGTDEESNLDNALALLEKASKEYKKARAGKDKISEESARILALKEKIAGAQTVQTALQLKYEAYESAEVRIKELSERAVVAQRQNEVLSDWAHYEYLLSLIRADRETLAALEGKYPAGLPTQEETLAVRERLLREEKYEVEAANGSFSKEDEISLSRLADVFKNGVPTEREMMDAEASIQTIAALDTEIRMARERSLSEAEKRLHAKFSVRVPSAEELKKAEADVEKYKTAKREMEEAPVYLSSGTASNSPEKIKRKGYLLTALFAVLAVVVGAVLLFVERLAGVAALCAGAVVLFADGFLYLNKKASGSKKEEHALENPDRRKQEEDARSAEDALKALLLPLGYSSGNGVLFDFATLKSDLSAYNAFTENEAERQRLIGEKETLKRERETFLAAFFREYCLEGENYLKNLSDLRSALDEYASLRARRTGAAEERKKLAIAIEENRAAIGAYIDKYRLSDLNIDRILEDIRTYDWAQQSLQKNVANAESFKRDKGLTEKPTEGKTDLTALNEELNALRKRNSILKQEIVADEYELERLDGYLRDKEQAEERLAEYKRRYKLLTATIELLLQADQRLKDRYVQPIKEEFLYYSSLIEKTLGEKVTMTKNFELRFERGGKERSEKHLSAGQRSVCALCFRLALIKNMYREQKPFLILDDPFVNLDAEHMQKVQAVLRVISAEIQLVYFSCHESRNI
ncbi:MAG: AAA family ATPase [Clostridia bacterium]|nr:AAA family ATPase [Clostridia bacterium]